MVITVIAILALLILPLFRDRVEAARRAAVQDELQSLVKAELLAYADTNYFYRLQDLDNGMEFNNPPVRPDQEVPIAYWNRPFKPEQRNKLVNGTNKWNGPYISLSKLKYQELRDAVAIPEFFWSFGGRGGPMMDILVAPLGSADWWPDPDIPILATNGMADQPEDRLLLDPWGTPYLFFGTGKLNEEGGAYTTQETSFGNAAVYSLGPDGMPGDSVPYQGNAQNLLRDPNIGQPGYGAIIGTGDDYVYYM